jgi:hypothetical protein
VRQWISLLHFLFLTLALNLYSTLFFASTPALLLAMLKFNTIMPVVIDRHHSSPTTVSFRTTVPE